jgi:hypothetical protein
MNDSVDEHQPTFGAFNAEMGFKMVYQQFLNERCTPEAIDHKVEEMNAEWDAIHRAQRGVGRWQWEIERDRAAIRRELEDHEARFQAFRRHYFFIDQFTENDARFPITLADCLNDV